MSAGPVCASSSYLGTLGTDSSLVSAWPQRIGLQRRAKRDRTEMAVLHIAHRLVSVSVFGRLWQYHDSVLGQQSMGSDHSVPDYQPPRKVSCAGGTIIKNK